MVRSGLFQRREIARKAVARAVNPRVLDVGCGSGRVAETLFSADIGEYVGVDFSAPMLELAKERLAQHSDQVTLLCGDFMTVELDGPFDIITVLGVFDYIEDPHRFIRRLGELCRGTLVASFPSWDWIKGPVRHIRYQWLNSCPIYDYTQKEVEVILKDCGFSSVRFHRKRGGFILEASV